jgi:hypothetical protein
VSERDDYPALASLADAAEGREKLPEAVRCYLEVGALRRRLVLKEAELAAAEVALRNLGYVGALTA